MSQSMYIPKDHDQFEEAPTLFIVAGDYEARFIFAANGEMEEKDNVQFSMREDGKEKQSYRSGNPSPEKTGAVSHYGKYHQDLKRKFYKSIKDRTQDLVEDLDVKKVILFAPQQSLKKIYDALRTEQQKIVQEQFTGIYTKKDLVGILDTWKKKRASDTGRVYTSEEEKKILRKPDINRKRVLDLDEE